jgi:hypothetical protein
MKVKFISKNSNEARLANRRALLIPDVSGRAPDEFMDMIYHPGHGEIFGFQVVSFDRQYSEVFTCDKAALQKEIDAMHFKSEEDKEKWLKNIKDYEAKIWQAYYDGEVYGILIQEWSDEAREFKTVDSFWVLYGFDDVKATIKDIVGNYDIDCFAVENELGDPENWREEYREFDVVDFS